MIKREIFVVDRENHIKFIVEFIPLHLPWFLDRRHLLEDQSQKSHGLPVASLGCLEEAEGYLEVQTPQEPKEQTVHCGLRVGTTVWLGNFSIDEAQERFFYGTYTKMLHVVLGISRKDEVSNPTLYGRLPEL
jgi:hypothetical protein